MSLPAPPITLYDSPLARLGLAAESPIRVGPAAPPPLTRNSTARRCYEKARRWLGGAVLPRN